MTRVRSFASVAFVCRDCDTNTHEIGEYYMLHDHIWKAACAAAPTPWPAPNVRGWMLCIGCVEARLGRTLHYADFLPCMLNRDPTRKRSERLAARLKATTYITIQLRIEEA